MCRDPTFSHSLAKITDVGPFRTTCITWDYHTGLSEIIRPNLFKHNLMVGVIFRPYGRKSSVTIHYFPSVRTVIYS